MRLLDLEKDRRKKARFPMKRELRYKVLDEGTIVESGMGVTVDMASGGIAFLIENQLLPGSFIELSIGWPVLLNDSCPMRLIVFGRVVRSSGRLTACTVDKYEFRTQGRAVNNVAVIRTDAMLQRWAEGIRKEAVKAISA